MIRIALQILSRKKLAGWMDGNWMGGWMGGKAGVRIAYSNKKVSLLFSCYWESLI